MTRNWAPIEVPSKNCKDCHKIIYLDSVKRRFYNDPELQDYHKCPNWTNPDFTPLYGELLQKLLGIQSSQNDLSHQMITISEDIAKTRKTLWELFLKVEDIGRKLAE